MKTYDVLVLGGGTAGTAAARTAQQAGARVAMFNDGELGGLCILRGCMPTKTMLHAAHLVHESRHASTPGVFPRGADFDFAAIMANKDDKVARFQRAKIAGIEAAGYEVIDARARFTGPDTVEAGGESYRFTRGAVLATGSVPAVPPLPGIESVDYLTSDEVMRLTEQPSSLIVLGAGAIGLELAQFFARLGTEVRKVCRNKVAWRVDSDVSAELEAVLRAEPHLDLRHGVRSVAVRRGGPGVQLELEDGDVVEAEALLVATGRRFNVEGLGLEAAGVAVEGGQLVLGPDMRTTNPRIFAAGDVTGERQLLHVANWEGAAAGCNAADPASRVEVERRLHMEVIFTDPPVASVGLSAASAAEEDRAAVTSLARFPETGRAITMDVLHGVSKLVADAHTGELLGAQILGPRADDVIHTLAAILYYRGTAAQMLEMPWYHPTISEVLLGQAREIVAAVDR